MKMKIQGSLTESRTHNSTKQRKPSAMKELFPSVGAVVWQVKIGILPTSVNGQCPGSWKPRFTTTFWLQLELLTRNFLLCTNQTSALNWTKLQVGVHLFPEKPLNKDRTVPVTPLQSQLRGRGEQPHLVNAVQHPVITCLHELQNSSPGVRTSTFNKPKFSGISGTILYRRASAWEASAIAMLRNKR